MKYKNRRKKLESRIKDWQQTQSNLKSQNPLSYRKPGSFKK